MAQPGDPQPPEPSVSDVDHDADVGFASAASLRGQSSRPDPEVEPAPEVETALPPDPGPGRKAVSPPLPTQAPRAYAEPPKPALATVPDWAVETPAAARPSVRGGRSARPRDQPAELEAATGLYAVYALILFAVPTLGVSALIALLAVTGRPGPRGPLAASHFVFQQRTLWAGAVAALLGGILIAVGLGVFVLFLLAVWLILRGAGGVLRLKAGRPIDKPRAWLF